MSESTISTVRLSQPELPAQRDGAAGVSAVKLSVIVLTHNEEANLPACLESLTGLPCKLFVVDSGSTDRTVAIATEHAASVLVSTESTDRDALGAASRC
jgi:cellulose synthase/poly-beta-1,6-N-acetylglucosamine synthase-like glycosyltransferase